MLSWLIGLFVRKEAERRQQRRSFAFVTEDQLEARLKEYTGEREFELTELFEKFSTLHARLAKRAKRELETSEPSKVAPSPAQRILELRRRYNVNGVV